MTDKQNPFTEFPQARIDAAKTDAANWKNGKAPENWVDPYKFHLTNTNIDASESAFVSRQLEHIRAGVYEVEYPELKGSRLVSTNTSVPTGKNAYTIRIMDKVGAADFVSDDATDISNVEVSTREATMLLKTIALAYKYTLQEARAAMSEGIPLLAKKAMVCREQMERFLDDVIFVGSTKAGFKGLLNATDTGIVTYTTPNGAAGDTEFSTKSADEVLKDMHGLVHKIVSDSKEVDRPDTLLLPLTTRLELQSRRVGDGTSTTIMTYFQGNDPYINMIEALYQLESNTAWTGKRMIAYKRDASCLDLIVSQPFEQLPPQSLGMTVNTVCRMRTGGLAIYRPTSIGRADQI